MNKKLRPNSKNNNKNKDNKFNPKNIIANVENNENIKPKILNFNSLNKLNNIVTEVPNFNQTIKNKNTKNINFNPNSIIASILNTAITNIVVPNTIKYKNSFSVNGTFYNINQ